jgi:branched-chain amino acid transport system substrate-binding protein
MSSFRVLGAGAILVAVGSWVGCAFGPLDSSAPSSTPTVRTQPAHRQAPALSGAPLTQQEKTLLTEIQQLYSKGSYSEVIEKSNDYESRFSSSSRLPEVLNLRGLALLLSKRPVDAASAFRLAIEKTPDALAGDRNWKIYVRYNRAAALVESGSSKQALEELKGIDPESYDPSNRVKFFQLKAKAHEQSGNLAAAAKEWTDLSRQSTAMDISRIPIEQQFESLLTRMRNLDLLEEAVENAEKTNLAPLAWFHFIRKELDENKSSKALDHIREFIKNYPNSPKVAEVTDWMRSLRQENSAAELSIGLLIPQTGKFARVGQRILNAVSLAMGIFASTEGESKIQLVIEDCGENPDTALLALERLHRKHRVAAVIGPILSKGAELVISKAEDYGLPLISLAQQSASFGEYTSQGAVTPKLQASEIARHAVQNLGLKKFAILAPKDRFGEEYSQEFWNAVESLGGTVTAYETYEPGETDFRQSMDRLAGLYYTDARKREVVALAKEREANQIKKRNRKTEKYFSLTPVVGFDAVFIPDEPKAVGLALPTFTYRDIDGVKFLGISSWNSPELLQRAQKSADGALFVDSFYPLAESATVRKFTDRFRTAFAHEPSSIEAIAFDAAAILERIVASESDGSGADRASVASRIRQIRDTPSVTGRITVKEGLWTRDLKILTIQDQQIAEAPRSETARGRSARPAD